MDLVYRTEIADGVFFSYYSESRFKLNRVDVIFWDTLDKSTVSLNALVPTLLSRTNSEYKTKTSFNKKLSGLYSASLGDYAHKCGDNEYFGLYCVSLDDAFALEDEKILEESTKMLKDCLFNPYLENGVFPENDVNIQKQNLIDDNNNEFNDKALYTARKGFAATFMDEPAALSVYGENSEIEKITPESAYSRYLEILEKKNVDIVCVGLGDFTVVKDIFAKAFSSVKRSPEPMPKNTPSKLKDKVYEASEEMDVSQSKLFISFKYKSDKRFPLFVMSNLFGGDTSSKLFTVVREKLSLCYYCYSGGGFGKRVLNVESGVETKNIEKAKAAIFEQLEEIKKGNFTDEDIQKTKLSLTNSLRSVNDRIGSISSWHLNCISNNWHKTPEEEIEYDNAVTREEIVEAANALELDTIFVLKSKEADE